MYSHLKRLWHDDCGAEMVEWAVVTIVLVGLTIVAIISIKDELLDMFVDAFDTIQKDPPDSYDNT